MKKSLIPILIISILFAYVNYTKAQNYAVYEVTLSHRIISNNSVGDDWEIIYTCENKEIKNKTKWIVPISSTQTQRQIKTINVTITEKDKIADIGTGTISIPLIDKNEGTTLVTVIEDGGNYERSEAIWEIHYIVKLAEKK